MCLTSTGDGERQRQRWRRMQRQRQRQRQRHLPPLTLLLQIASSSSSRWTPSSQEDDFPRRRGPWQVILLIFSLKALKQLSLVLYFLFLTLVNNLHSEIITSISVLRLFFKSCCTCSKNNHKVVLISQEKPKWQKISRLFFFLKTFLVTDIVFVLFRKIYCHR